MALLTTQKLYVDAEKSDTAYKGWNDTSAANRTIFYEGDTPQLEVYLVRLTNSASYPMQSVAFPSATLYYAVGNPGGTQVNTNNGVSAISAGTATWSSPVLTIPSEATGGSFTLTITNGSPALTATTVALTKEVTASEISAAIVTAVNAKSGWSACSATVTQTSETTFNIAVVATNTATVYTLTLAVTSSLTGASGYKGSISLTGPGVATLLGASAEVTTYLEVQCDTGSAVYQTFLQIPITLKAKVISN
jgi:hypothetical protein